MSRSRWGALVVAGCVAIGGVTGASAQTPAQDGPPECGTEAGAGRTGADDGVLRIASYNVLHTRGRYDDETLDRRVELAVEALAGTESDVIGLQEVTASANHGLVAQRIAAGLAATTGDDWTWCFFRSNPHIAGEPDTGPGGIGGPASQQIALVARDGDSPWSEGVAILSRFGIADQRVHRLPPRTAEIPFCIEENPDNPLAGPTCQFDTRTIMWGRVDAPCGSLDMFTSHLANTESSQSENIRLLQITDALLQIDQIATDGPLPDVYVGDFNTLEDGPVWQAAIDAGFIDSFRVAEPDDPGFTSGQEIDDPSPTVTRRIDYVFARPGTAPLAPADGDVFGDSPVPFAGSGEETVVWPSDHYGVAVSLVACAATAAPPETGSTDTLAPVVGGTSLPATGGDAVPLWTLGLVALAAGAALRRASA